MPVIAFDATPLTPFPGSYGGHAVRGIGRYVRSVLNALATERPDWIERNLAVVRTADVSLPWWNGPQIVTRRVRFRPQDVGWLSAPLFDALATGRHQIDGWTTSDPMAPLRPPRTGRSVVIAYDLILLGDPRALGKMQPHRRLVYRAYLRRLRRADVVIAISHTVATELARRLGIAAERIHVVYPGLVASPMPEHRPAAGSLDLLFVGVPAAHKNPMSAIDATAELVRRGHDVRLRFVGTQQPAAQRRLSERATTAGIAQRVDHLGHIGDEQLNELYRTSVLLCPSSDEGLGLAPIEAVLAGGRVVCGPAPAFREAVGDAAAYADPADPESMADAYEANLAAGPADGARALVAERFSARACAAAAVAAFEADV